MQGQGGLKLTLGRCFFFKLILAPSTVQTTSQHFARAHIWTNSTLEPSGRFKPRGSGRLRLPRSQHCAKTLNSEVCSLVQPECLPALSKLSLFLPLADLNAPEEPSAALSAGQQASSSRAAAAAAQAHAALPPLPLDMPPRQLQRRYQRRPAEAPASIADALGNAVSRSRQKITMIARAEALLRLRPAMQGGAPRQHHTDGAAGPPVMKHMPAAADGQLVAVAASSVSCLSGRQWQQQQQQECQQWKPQPQPVLQQQQRSSRSPVQSAALLAPLLPPGALAGEPSVPAGAAPQLPLQPSPAVVPVVAQQQQQHQHQRQQQQEKEQQQKPQPQPQQQPEEPPPAAAHFAAASRFLRHLALSTSSGLTGVHSAASGQDLASMSLHNASGMATLASEQGQNAAAAVEEAQEVAEGLEARDLRMALPWPELELETWDDGARHWDLAEVVAIAPDLAAECASHYAIAGQLWQVSQQLRQQPKDDLLDLGADEALAANITDDGSMLDHLLCNASCAASAWQRQEPHHGGGCKAGADLDLLNHVEADELLQWPVGRPGAPQRSSPPASFLHSLPCNSTFPSGGLESDGPPGVLFGGGSSDLDGCSGPALSAFDSFGSSGSGSSLAGAERGLFVLP